MILYNSLMTSLVIHFGVKEVDLAGETGDTGLWIDDKYYKDENGNERGLDDYTYPDGTKVEGVKTVLGKACDKSTIQYWWDSIFSNSFGNNPCRLLNFIWGYSEKEEKSKPGLKIDQSLIIATIFYAYDEQPGYDSYDNPSTVGQKTVSTDHRTGNFQILSSTTGQIQRSQPENGAGSWLSHLLLESCLCRLVSG